MRTSVDSPNSLGIFISGHLGLVVTLEPGQVLLVVPGHVDGKEQDGEAVYKHVPCTINVLHIELFAPG